jgi:hypothetical protein
VTDFRRPAEPARIPGVDDIVCRDSLGRVLLETAARAARGRNLADLDRLPVLGRRGEVPQDARRAALAGEASAEAVPVSAVDRIDADAVAAWIIGQYPAETYPGVVLGSAHGAAVHLAAAAGAPWLPTAFTVTVPWPGGSVGAWDRAAEWGARLVRQVLAANPDVAVRQIHDPLRRGHLCGSTITLHLRWRRLPAAYRDFLRHRLAPGAASLQIRDIRTWPVLDVGPGHTFQIGGPAGGWPFEDFAMDNPSFRRLIDGIGGNRWPAPPENLRTGYAESAGEPGLDAELRRIAAETNRPAHRVLYPDPGALSACVADLLRDRLRHEPGGGEHCVVETGRMLDAGQVLAAGLVPYWCESASRRAADAAEWWLAGSLPFTSVTVLPEAPGTACDAHADPAQWRSVASFARDRAQVDRLAISRYPMLPLASSHAAYTLSRTPARPAVAPRLPMAQALAALRRTGPTMGLFVA